MNTKLIIEPAASSAPSTPPHPHLSLRTRASSLTASLDARQSHRARHLFIMYVSATYPTAVMVPAPSTAPHMYS